VIAVASNTLFKAGMAAFMGAPGLRRIILTAAGVILMAAVLGALVPVIGMTGVLLLCAWACGRARG
jgi:hypothetical protein